MPRRFEHPGPGRGPRGFVLLTTVILLVVLAAISLTALRGTLQQERMASNDRDVALARQHAEMALRDAERDLLGLSVDGKVCDAAANNCPNPRPVGTRPNADTAPAAFWIAASRIPDPNPNAALTNEEVVRPETHMHCGSAGVSRSVWLAADWDARDPPGACDVASQLGAISLPTVALGTFTGATAPPDVPAPRYLIEITGVQADPSGQASSSGSERVVFRITAVGFGRTSTNGRRTAVMLQTVFSPS